jgi:hypothetical protein
VTAAALPAIDHPAAPAPVTKWLETASIGFRTVMAAINASIVNVAAHGMDTVSAQAAAPRAMARRVGLQATVLAFERVFLLHGLVFVGVLPRLLCLREKSESKHVEMSME